jgi:hypothetical protein
MESGDFTSARPPGETADAGRKAVGEAVRETGEDSGWVTTKVAAKVLGVSRRMVQEYVRRGELRAITEERSVNKRYYVSIDSLNVLRELRRRGANSSSVSGRTANLGQDIDEVLYRTVERLEARTAEAAELKTRLELTAQAETSAREERERLLADLERERERADRLEEELRRSRRGWFRRFFGL